MKLLLTGGLLLVSVLTTGCDGGGSNNDTTVSDDVLNSEKIKEELIPATIELQAIRLKAHDGFNQLSNDLINGNLQMLTKVDGMLKRMYDNNEILIQTLEALSQPFEITTNDPLTVNPDVSSTTPPFTIGASGLSNDYFLLSSSSRFLTPKNELKTRFKTTAELTTAWLRAVEFSDQRCVYVALQSVDANGNVTSASNTLVVPLVSANQCAPQL